MFKHRELIFNVVVSGLFIVGGIWISNMSLVIVGACLGVVILIGRIKK